MTQRSTRLVKFLAGKSFTAVTLITFVYLLATPQDVTMWLRLFGPHYAIAMGFWALWIYAIADLAQRGFWDLLEDK